MVDTQSQANSDWNSTAGCTQILNKPAINPLSMTKINRSLNTAFQISTTRNAMVMYTVQMTVTASITGGQNGDVILETADDQPFTQNVDAVNVTGFGQTYTLAIALQGVQPDKRSLVGAIQAGKWVRIRTVNNTGTPSFTFISGQEVLM